MAYGDPMTRADARALLAARERRARGIEPESPRSLRRFVGLSWSVIVLVLLALMLMPLAFGAVDLVLHP